MASICILMAMAEYPLLFSLKHTPSDYLVSTIFVQEELFPIVGVNFYEENFLSYAFQSAGNSPVAKKLAMWAYHGAFSTRSRDSLGNSSLIGGL